MIWKNPEVQRKVWQEFSPYRLYLAPLFLAAILCILYLFFGEKLTLFFTVSGFFTGLMFCVSVFLYGSKHVGESVVSEIQGRTWESQRMTSLGAWEMTVGKLVGGSLYSWYSGGFCLAYLLALSLISDSPGLFSRFLLILVLAGLLSQTLGLMLNLIRIQKDREAVRLRNSLFLIPGLLLFFYMVFKLVRYCFWSPYDIAGLTQQERMAGMDWYRLSLSVSEIWIAALAFFLFWAVVGAYRQMRLELQMKNTPWVWLLFTLSTIGFAAGFIADIRGMNVKDQVRAALYLGFLINHLFCYIALFSWPKEIVGFRVLWDAARKGRARAFWAHFPPWLVSLILSGLFFVACLTVSPLDGRTQLPFHAGWVSGVWFLNLLLFLLRDLSIVLFFNLEPGAGPKGDIRAVALLFILYLILPLALGGLGKFDWAAAFWPLLKSPLAHETVPIIVQFVIAFFLMVNRWRMVNRLMESQ